MEELERLINEYGENTQYWVNFDHRGDILNTEFYFDEKEQAKQNLLNYIEQNYERKKAMKETKLEFDKDLLEES